MISGLSDSSVSKGEFTAKKGPQYFPAILKPEPGTLEYLLEQLNEPQFILNLKKMTRGKSSRITMDRQTSIPSNRSKSRRRLRHACIRHVRLPDFHPQYLGIAHDTIIQKEEPENLQKSRDNANSKTTAMKKLQLKKKRSPILPIKRQRW